METAELHKILELLKNEQWRGYNNYGEAYFEEFNKMLNGYFFRNSWLGRKEPRDITPEVEKTYFRLRKLFYEIAIVFPDFKRTPIRKDSFLKNKSLNPEMEKMLARKSHLFEKGEVSRNVLILTVIKGLLKSYLEKVRRCRFDKFGYQQLQVDIYMLLQVSFDIVSIEDENIILGFYHEIMESAGERTLEPTPLDNTIIETISNVKRGKIKF